MEGGKKKRVWAVTRWAESSEAHHTAGRIFFLIFGRISIFRLE
jgi:hypothetical protein